MVKILFSKKGVRATIGRKSSVFNKIMENKNISRVVNTNAEKREFYGALREEALKKGSIGITKKTLKRVLGKLESSKSLSNYERHVIGKELVGGSASSRVIHEQNSTEKLVEKKPEVDMKEIRQERIDKEDASSNNQSPEVQKSNLPESSVLGLELSNSQLHKAESLLSQADSELIQNRPSSTLSYIERKKSSREDMDEIKARLAKIQENPDKNEKINLAA